MDTQGASGPGSFGEGHRSWVPVLPLSHFAMGLEQVPIVPGRWVFQKDLPDLSVSSQAGSPLTGTHSSVPQMFAGWVPVPGSKPGVGGPGNTPAPAVRWHAQTAWYQRDETLRHLCALHWEIQPLALGCLHQTESVSPRPHLEPGDGQFTPCRFQWPLKHLWGRVRCEHLEAVSSLSELIVPLDVQVVSFPQKCPHCT